MATTLCAQLGQIVGSVIDVTGAILSRGIVSLDAGPDEATLNIRLDERGRFRFVGIPPGEHRLTVTVPGFDPLVVRIRVEEDEARELPLLQVNIGSSGCFRTDADPEWTKFLKPDSGAWIAGTVVSEQGPVAGARISVSCASGLDCYRNPWLTTTSTSGHFELAGLPPGRVLVSVEQEGFMPLRNTPLGVTAGVESSYTFRLRRNGDPGAGAAKEPVICE